MNQPLVSVVIPTFNRAYCLGRAVDSALQQTHANMEVVVVDDGSTDDTASTVAAQYGHDSRVRYIHQSNQGVAAARNTGLAAARGEFVALLDSDDIWRPWKVDVQLAVFNRFPDVGMVWTDMEAIDAEGRVIEEKHLRTMYGAYRWFAEDRLFKESFPLQDLISNTECPVESSKVYRGDIFSPMVMGNLVHTSTVLLRRERLEAVVGFDPTYTPVGEDYDFHLRTCREGPVAFVDVSSIQYQREFGDQLTQPGFRLAFAQSHLAIVTRTMEQDRDRIRLPQSMIKACLADAHGWIGQAALDQGDTRLARKHLHRSMTYRPDQLRTGLMFLLACLPHDAGNRLRATYRQVKRSVLGAGPQVTSSIPPLGTGSEASVAH